MSEEPKVYRPRCRNLMCKSMLVAGEDFENDPEYQGGTVDFWCQCTATSQGPDRSFVTLELCSEPTRDCFQEY